MSDESVAGLMQNARALLFPSFAEGYGLPLAEALAAGCPVIASDLPALREVGAEVPDYLEPRNPDAWAKAISDYAADPAPRRAAQLDRLAGWSAPTWGDHFDRVGNFLETILVQSGGGG